LHVAAYKGHIKIVRWLIVEGKASVNAATVKGETPLWVAAHLGDMELVRWLVQAGKASVDQANTNGLTPLYIAAQNGHIEIVVWLIGEGKASVNQANKNGFTPLSIAAYMGQGKIVSRLIKEGKASVDHVSKDGQTPLFAAIQRCSQWVIRQANSEATPLSTAGYKCDMDILRWLVEEGNANVNAVSTNGATPLYAALHAEVVNVEVVHFLLSVGARVKDLGNPAFNSYAMASIQRKVQKLEV
jgi:ankyrin repeat protein